MAPSLRPAATVLVLRSGPEGPELFMVQRHRRSGFMPSAWVFPGGRVDPGDDLRDHPAVRGGERALQRMGLARPQGLGFLVAAVRETFEESGIWLGSGQPPAQRRQELASGALSMGDLLDAHRLQLDLDALLPWSWWITPERERRRYDTRFLLARAPAAQATQSATHDARETVASAWIRPSTALVRAEAGELRLAPPTWWTLRELAAHDSISSAMAAAAKRPQRPIQPVLQQTDEGLQLLLPGHEAHRDPPIRGLPPRIVFRQGRWWAED